jgi:hypothetical protein
MTCRSCGTEIADKAIVCYRCGAPTAEAPVRPVSRKRRPNWAALPVLLLILALGAWLIPKTTPGSPARIGAWVVTWIVVFAAVAWAQRRVRS